MRPLNTIVPDADGLVALSEDDLCRVILEAIRLEPGDQGRYHRQQVIFAAGQRDADNVDGALNEAWQHLHYLGWLVRVGQYGWSNLTQRGRDAMNNHPWGTEAPPPRIPEGLLHDEVRREAIPNYLAGRYDQAVFAAIRRVEIVVRTAAGEPAASIGTSLMRAAFQPERGPLRDAALEASERQGEMDLFGGVVGAYRNAVGHRDVGLGATEAAQVLVLTSLLLSIVDRRR